MTGIAAALALTLVTASLAPAQRATPAGNASIDAFNRAFASATRAMDNSSILALWDEDGVSLLPSTKPIIGKAAITKFLTDVTASLAGAHMTKFESACFDVRVSGDWASEWCTEHQIVSLSDGKPPFNGYGKMLLVLHRSAGGAWRIHEEMWNQALAPDSGGSK
ncbi:MAG: YybH family protein [Gemmatimonas sp.]|nr:nuclear transport factor 2 family protein [Gemmatimonadaceae bacterium]